MHAAFMNMHRSRCIRAGYASTPVRVPLKTSLGARVSSRMARGSCTKYDERRYRHGDGNGETKIHRSPGAPGFPSDVRLAGDRRKSGVE